MALPPNLNKAILRRRSEEQRARSMVGGYTEVLGKIEVQNAGEALWDARFPVEFIEEPFIVGGGFLLPDQPIELTNVPTSSVTGKQWLYKILPTGQRLYVGATLILVSTGLATQRLKFHYIAVGRALVNPLQADFSTDDVI